MRVPSSRVVRLVRLKRGGVEGEKVVNILRVGGRRTGEEGKEEEVRESEEGVVKDEGGSRGGGNSRPTGLKLRRLVKLENQGRMEGELKGTPRQSREARRGRETRDSSRLSLSLPEKVSRFLKECTKFGSNSSEKSPIVRIFKVFKFSRKWNITWERSSMCLSVKGKLTTSRWRRLERFVIFSRMEGWE